MVVLIYILICLCLCMLLIPNDGFSMILVELSRLLLADVVEVYRSGGENFEDIRLIASQLLGHVKGVREFIVSSLSGRLLNAVQQLHLYHIIHKFLFLVFESWHQT